jgi:hypothetical protein
VTADAAPARPDLVLISHEAAQEVDGVIDVLRDEGLVVLRLNLCRYPDTVATKAAGAIRFGDDVLAAPAKVGWLHNTGWYSFANELNGIERELAQRECDAFWHGAFPLLARNWLNEPDAIIRASYKLRQLQLAEDLGVPLPPYLATNDPRAIRAFRADHPKAVIKGVRGGYVVHPQGAVKLVTRRVEFADDEFEAGLGFSPVIVQREIAKARELRVTVVAGECFCMTTNCAGMPDGVVDIRLLDYESERWRFSGEPAPENVVRDSLRVVQALGLSYAGLDWVVDEDNVAYFLECNPLGSFKWAEMCTGHDITRAIAAQLLTLAHREVPNVAQ